jgi:tubulin polyglutamylase TTLL4
LSSSSPLDKKIKTTLICDSLNLIGIVPYDRKLYEKELEDA